MSVRLAALVLISLLFGSCATSPKPVSRQSQVAVYDAVLQAWLGADYRSALVDRRLLPAPSAVDRNDSNCMRGVDFHPAAGGSSALRSLRGVSFARKGVRVIDGAIWKPVDDPLMPHRAGDGPRTLNQDIDRAMDHSLITFSQIRFDTSRRWALLRFSSVCGTLCGAGSTYLMHKNSSTWTVFKRCDGWVS